MNTIHKWCAELADEFQGSGVDQKLFVQSLNEWEVPITKEFLIEIWRLFQVHMFGTTSKTELTTDQVSQVYDAMNFFISTKFGVSTDFGAPVDK